MQLGEIERVAGGFEAVWMDARGLVQSQVFAEYDAAVDYRMCPILDMEAGAAGAPDAERPHPEGDRAKPPLRLHCRTYVSSFSNIQVPRAYMSSAGMARV